VQEFLFTEGLGDAWAGIHLAVEENDGKNFGLLKSASHIINGTNSTRR